MKEKLGIELILHYPLVFVSTTLKSEPYRWDRSESFIDLDKVNQRGCVGYVIRPHPEIWKAYPY
jgi:hypothetical protein